jgi:DtxR family Mn-dependent transcriptional regulator
VPNILLLSPAHEDYLKAIFDLSAGERRVQTTELARRLGVRKPSVSAMLKRLADSGLVDYSPRRGARPTEAGRVCALQVLRRHRLVKAFLVESLGLDWAEVHEEAEVLEHHLSERLVEAIDWVLGHPLEDPHGHPIPDAEGRVRARALVPLAVLREGEGGTIRELRSDDAGRLRRWQELRLVPGAEFMVLQRQELEDVMRIRAGGRTVVTGSAGVEGLFAERARQ